jgi:hypothetical protein
MAPYLPTGDVFEAAAIRTPPPDAAKENPLPKAVYLPM